MHHGRKRHHRGLGLRWYDRENVLERLESYQRDLEQELADVSDLITRLQTAVENAVRENRLNHQEAGRFLKFYEEALNGYTYLEEPGD